MSSDSDGIQFVCPFIFKPIFIFAIRDVGLLAEALLPPRLVSFRALLGIQRRIFDDIRIMKSIQSEEKGFAN